MLESRSIVDDLIKKEIENGILPERIFIGGFSQGGCLAFLYATTTEQQIGGVVALSTKVP